MSTSTATAAAKCKFADTWPIYQFENRTFIITQINYDSMTNTHDLALCAIANLQWTLYRTDIECCSQGFKSHQNRMVPPVNIPFQQETRIRTTTLYQSSLELGCPNSLGCVTTLVTYCDKWERAGCNFYFSFLFLLLIAILVHPDFILPSWYGVVPGANPDRAQFRDLNIWLWHWKPIQNLAFGLLYECVLRAAISCYRSTVQLRAAK